MIKSVSIVLVAVVTLLPFERPHAQAVDGAKIFWSSSGEGEQTVIFVHGWTCDQTSWEAQVPVIGRQARVISMDLPGHGRSGLPEGGKFSMEMFARAIEAVRIEAGAGRVVLVGHSMGTPVIRQYTLMFPESVSALVLVDGLVQVPGISSSVSMPMTGWLGKLVRRVFIWTMYGPSTSEELKHKIREMMMAAPEVTAAGAFKATWDSSKWTGDTVTVPVLAIYASSSTVSREGIDTIYPTLQFHEIPGTGHFLMMEKPAEFNRILGNFLAEIRKKEDPRDSSPTD